MFCYLALFTWNARTGYLDTVAERSGLEIVGYVLSPITWAKDTCVEYWQRYLALIDVAEENERLRSELRSTRMAAMLSNEDKAELERLRRLLSLEPLRERPGFAARVIAKRFGPQAVLKTFTINKGYLDGAVVGTPVINENGVIGRVLRAAPHAATVIMLTDPGFRLAVITQNERTPGILTGTAGAQRHLEVQYVSQTARIAPGDLLITAGIDGAFPKGIPVGIVTEVTPGNEILFQQVRAMPFVDLENLEEVVLLQQEGSGAPLLEPVPNPLVPDPLIPSILGPLHPAAPAQVPGSTNLGGEGQSPSAPPESHNPSAQGR